MSKIKMPKIGETGQLLWRYDPKDSSLTLSGTGALPDYPIGKAPWFEFNDQIDTVVLKEGVTRIGDYAFYNCTELTSVEIPEGITYIGESAFACCQSLESVTIPGSVTEIGEGAFESCDSMMALELASGLKCVGAFAFSECVALRELILPDTVERIERSAFAGTMALHELVIPGNVQEIGDNAFNGCIQLSSLTLSEGIRVIEEMAFSNCSDLTKVLIPASVECLGDGVFSDCLAMTQIAVAPESEHFVVRDDILYSKDLSVLVHYPAAKEEQEFTIPEEVRKIAGLAFASNYFLMEVMLGDHLEEVGSYAFARCSSLSFMSLPAQTTRLGASPFHDCTMLLEIEVDPSNPCYSSIDGVLYNKEQTQLIQYPAGLYDDFYKVPDTVREIAENACYDAQDLEVLKIPAGVRKIGDMAFAFCDQLRDVEIRVADPAQIEVGLMAFFSVAGTPRTLRVPKGSSKLYKKSEQWQDLAKKIIEQ
ncbi:leucine-rich repeat domain-containing protein [uncultured Porphyromonas sp.]|uniref:leucine-rich repeat domain-containing protein n=1 Tax=uncultured Porphyromonas sp. TaxID=159274 RepID=UPI00266CD9FA|nr:leucine-rich repeat domain-containing protein [uncultured Porphyromonas sp.]